jgi:hypothetical protein
MLSNSYDIQNVITCDQIFFLVLILQIPMYGLTTLEMLLLSEDILIVITK